MAYKIIRLADGPRLRWCVVVISLRGDETWDVIQTFTTRTEAALYRDEVVTRNATLEAAGCP